MLNVISVILVVGLAPGGKALSPAYNKALSKFNKACGELDASTVEAWMDAAEKAHSKGDSRGAIGRDIRRKLKDAGQSTPVNRSCIAAIAGLATTAKHVPPRIPGSPTRQLILDGNKELDKRIEFWRPYENPQRPKHKSRVKELAALRGKYMPTLRLEVGNIGVFRTTYIEWPPPPTRSYYRGRGSQQFHPSRDVIPSAPKPRGYRTSYGVRIVQIQDERSALVRFGSKTIWLSDIDTSGKTDEEHLPFGADVLFVVVGTKTYITGDGPKTIFAVKPFDD